MVDYRDLDLGDYALDDRKLTIMEQRFVEAYPLSNSGAEAARKAGYAEKHAGRRSQELLQKPHIKRAIEKRQTQYSQYANVTAYDIVSELDAIRVAALGAKPPQCAAAVNATVNKARILGLDVIRIDHTSGGEKIQAGLGHFYAQQGENLKTIEHDDGEDD